LIVKSQPLQSQGLVINSKPSIPQNPNSLWEKECQPFKISYEDDLFDPDFGNNLNFQSHKRPSSEYNSNPIKKGPLESILIPI
jgi:hypothetical protein